MKLGDAVLCVKGSAMHIMFLNSFKVGVFNIL